MHRWGNRAATGDFQLTKPSVGFRTTGQGGIVMQQEIPYHGSA